MNVIPAPQFLPYFLLEAYGISLPLIGLTSLDSTYEWSTAFQLIMLMLSCFCGLIAYIEFKEILPADLFTYYHFPLSAAILQWQLKPTTSLIGILFFAMPHMFTMWGAMTTYSKSSLPSALL